MTNENESDVNLENVFVSPMVEFKFDLPRLKEAVFQIIAKYPFNTINQLNLTSPSETEQSVYQGIGSIYNRETKVWLARESDFIFFNKEFESNYLFEVYTALKEFIPWNIGRVRIMKLEPKRCYSFHRDDDYRVHIALETNPQCFLMFMPGPYVNIPADGTLFFTNTMKTHSAMNGGMTDRYHLVFSTYE